MRLHLTIWMLAATVGTAFAGPIDFTPTEGSRTLEGVVFKQLRFRQDGHVITYEPPIGWKCTGDAGGMRLAPPDVSQAQVTVEQGPLAAPQVFDEAMTKQLEQFVLASAPSGALNVAVLAEEQNPLRIHLQETYGVTIGYNFARPGIRRERALREPRRDPVALPHGRAEG